MLNLRQLINAASHAALKAGIAIMDIYRSERFETEMKAMDQPVTRADKAAHDIIIKELALTNIPVLSEESNQTDYTVRQMWPILWLVDPLDGTKEFINQNGEFTINIALIVHGNPVAGIIYVPCYDTLYYGSAETGVFKIECGKKKRLSPSKQKITFKELLEKPSVTVVASRSHLSEKTRGFIAQFKHPKLEQRGSALKFMLLAEHKADIYPRLAPTMEWDTAAAQAILNSLGRGIYQTDMETELTYNKPQLQNPEFIAF